MKILTSNEHACMQMWLDENAPTLNPVAFCSFMFRPCTCFAWYWKTTLNGLSFPWFSFCSFCLWNNTAFRNSTVNYITDKQHLCIMLLSVNITENVEQFIALLHSNYMHYIFTYFNRLNWSLTYVTLHLFIQVKKEMKGNKEIKILDARI